MTEFQHSVDGTAAPPGRVVPTITAHPLQFTGSGTGYFRVWIVNLLLSILTLGFYTPWARRRTAQYFYSHSQVAGSPLEFTAPQGRMVFGFVVLVLLSIAYQLAARTGQDLAVALFLLGAAVLAPLVWGSAMRFRLGATRWRGLRLQFTARWAEVYRASWPVFAMALVWIGLFFALQALASHGASPGAVADSGATGNPAPARPNLGPLQGLQHSLPAVLALVLLALLLSVLCFIRLEFNYRRLLVHRAQLGAERGRWKPVYLDFVKIWLATLAVLLLCLAVAVVALGVLGAGLLLPLSGLREQSSALVIAVLVLLLAASSLLLFLASAPARAYREARLFHLTWNQIGLGRIARFKCRLRTGRYVALRLKNLALNLLTLGLYRPFALVSEYRMKFDSVTLHLKGGVDAVAGALVQPQSGGVGDALADAAGLDLIG